MRIPSWMVRKPNEPMTLAERDEVPGPGEVIVEVAGCGVCHTDLGFFYDGVATRHPLPLTLGHEVSGRVVEAGPGAERWVGRAVVVPAVIPCGVCPACLAGRGGVCPKQVFPGNDVHGGFGTHLKVPSRGLCAVPDLSNPDVNPAGLALSDLSVIADAISTPYQAIVHAELKAGDLAVFVGAGGVGGFGAQVAAALGARVIAIDTSAERRELAASHGADLALEPGAPDGKAVRGAVRDFAAKAAIPSWRWKIFETSGSPQGQATAFALLGPGAHLGVVGYTPAKVEVRLSNLMAFDASARGTWGCLPELYPNVLNLVLAGRVALTPFLERRPLASINRTFEDLHGRKVSRRVVLIP